MNIREELASKISKLPDGALPKVYEFIEDLENREREPGLLKRLQKIKIDGPPDFAENIDLYLSGEKQID